MPRGRRKLSPHAISGLEPVASVSLDGERVYSQNRAGHDKTTHFGMNQVELDLVAIRRSSGTVFSRLELVTQCLRTGAE